MKRLPAGGNRADRCPGGARTGALAVRTGALAVRTGALAARVPGRVGIARGAATVVSTGLMLVSAGLTLRKLLRTASRRGLYARDWQAH